MTSPRPVLVQPRPLVWWRVVLVAGTLALWTWWSMHRGTPSSTVLSWSGETQGTWYRIQVVAPSGWNMDRDRLVTAVTSTLAEIDRALSLWNPESELVRFNREPAHRAIAVSSDLYECARVAREVAEASGGAFDPTLAPLIRAWGFGPNEKVATDSNEIAQARTRVGWKFLTIGPPGQLVKECDGLELDLNAVAQGYTADRIAAVLRSFGAERFLVEVGGELVVSGLSPRGQPWRIGIDVPVLDRLPGEQLVGTLSLTHGGVATSGGYRHRVQDPTTHRVRTHILDGRTGEPVARERMSVTVVASNAAWADALATAVFALGPEEGVPWIERNYPSAAALVVMCESDSAQPQLRATSNWVSRTRFQESF